MSIGLQILWLLVLAIPIASISWTVTHEEVFREPREYLIEKSRTSERLLQRKFFYLFTCHFCFSHWVALLFLLFADFRLLYEDWRGYVVALFALVWVANQYMSIHARLRLDVKRERAEIAVTEQVKEELEEEDQGDEVTRK